MRTIFCLLIISPSSWLDGQTFLTMANISNLPWSNGQNFDDDYSTAKIHIFHCQNDKSKNRLGNLTKKVHFDNYTHWQNLRMSVANFFTIDQAGMK